jgi:GNAT superfamily N-acetyltransferase
LKQFREWVDAQWDEVDPFSGVAGGISVPSPILAIDDQKLLGGLAFTSSSIPGGEEAGIWVNALLVATEYRRIGIASELVKAAVVEAGRFKLKELFVYTDVPELYQKLSWCVVDGPGESTVLKRVVIN